MKKYLIIGIVFVSLVCIGLYVNSLLISDEPSEGIVKIYLGNSKMSDYTDCTDVFDVPRTIIGEDLYALTVAELIKGPTTDEDQLGYFTSLPETQVKSVEVNGGIAYVDFESSLQEGVAGSCRVQNIRSQIEETLKQFPEIQDVIISIDRKIEDILQP